MSQADKDASIGFKKKKKKLWDLLLHSFWHRRCQEESQWWMYGSNMGKATEIFSGLGTDESWASKREVYLLLLSLSVLREMHC